MSKTVLVNTVSGAVERLTFRQIAFVIFSLALVIRLAYVLTIPNEIRPLDYDGHVYDLIARNIVDGKGFNYDTGVNQSWRPPLYPLFLALNYLLFGQNYIAVRVVQALLGASTCVVAFLIARDYLGKGTGIIASLIVALYPGLVYFTGLLVTETLFILLVVSATLFLLRFLKTWSLRDGGATGILLGLSALCRPQVLAFVPFLFVVLFLASKTRKPAIANFIPVFLVILAIILPWTLRNYAVHGEFVLISTNGGYNFYVGNNPEATGRLTKPYFSSQQQALRDELTEAKIDTEYYKWGLDYIRGNPLASLKMAAKKVGILWFEPTIGKLRLGEWLFVLVAAAGLVRSFSIWRRYVPLYAMILALSLPPLLYFAEGRFRLPMVPFLAIFAAYGIAWMLRMMNRRLNGATSAVAQ